MDRYTFKPDARPPDINEETAVLDAIADEILQKLVLEGSLAPLTEERLRFYENDYKQRQPSTKNHHSRSS